MIAQPGSNHGNFCFFEADTAWTMDYKPFGPYDFSKAICNWYRSNLRNPDAGKALAALDYTFDAKPMWHPPGRAEMRRIDPGDGKARTLQELVHIHADGSHTCRELYEYWTTLEEAKPAPTK